MAHGVERNLHRRISGAGRRMFKCKKDQPPARESGAAESVMRNGLSGLDREDLAAFVVAAGRAGLVRRNGAAALAALVEQRGVKAVGGFARAQPHLGHLAFWNSHSQLVFLILSWSSAPHASRVSERGSPAVSVFDPRKYALADSLAIPVAMRMGRKGEQDVFPHGLCQVHHFGAGQFDLAGEIGDSQRVAEVLQTGDALELEIDADLRPWRTARRRSGRRPGHSACR